MPSIKMSKQATENNGRGKQTLIKIMHGNAMAFSWPDKRDRHVKRKYEGNILC